MTFDELSTHVANLTNHPEMVGEITTAVQSSTLKMHQSDYYTRDAVEQQLILPLGEYVSKVDLGIFTRFRAVRYLRKWDPSIPNVDTGQITGDVGPFLHATDPEDVIDSYGYNRVNSYYVAGNYLNIRSNTQQRQYLLSYYQFPQVAPKDKYSSWIADVVPFAIIFDASSLIFQMLAMQDQARKFDAMVLEQLHQVQMHGLNARGF